MSTNFAARLRQSAIPTILFAGLLVAALLNLDALHRWVALSEPAAPVSSSSTANDAIAYHTCPMHPSVRQAGPGSCPICGMDLTPVTRAEEASGVLLVDAQRRQRIGVRTAEVRSRPLRRRIRSYGKVTFDEARLAEVTLKYDGWIRGLRANETGMKVRRGDVLFAVYSPAVYAAQGDFVTAVKAPKLEGFGPATKGDPLVDAAREKLSLLDAYGMGKVLRNRGKPVRYISVTAPFSGTIIDKNVVEGSAVRAGATVMRIADLSRLWIEADLYEHDLRHVGVGTPVTLTLPYGGGSRRATIDFVDPVLDPKSRTAHARIEVGAGESLRPGMFVDVAIEVDLGARLQVPREAVVETGSRQLVFRDLGDGRLQPTVVKLGARGDDAYEVVDGLKAGERIVVSGNFLLAAESRIRSAERFWSATPHPSAGKASGGDDHRHPHGHEHAHDHPPMPAPPPPKARPTARPQPKPRPRRAAKPRPRPTSAPKPSVTASPAPPPPPKAPVYTCPMHPQVLSKEPGRCPICNMFLKPKSP